MQPAERRRAPQVRCRAATSPRERRCGDQVCASWCSLAPLLDGSGRRVSPGVRSPGRRWRGGCVARAVPAGCRVRAAGAARVRRPAGPARGPIGRAVRAAAEATGRRRWAGRRVRMFAAADVRSVGTCGPRLSVATTVKPSWASAWQRLSRGMRCRCCGWSHGPHHWPSVLAADGLRVGDLDQEVTAGPERQCARRQFLPGRRRVFQVVVHAHHVVPSGQRGGQAGEGALVGPAMRPLRTASLDAFAPVEPVECPCPGGSCGLRRRSGRGRCPRPATAGGG